MGSHSEDSLETTTMYKLLIASVLAVATSLPIEDTAEVAAAKEVFNAAFAAAEAGEHINLRPVNDDAQAAQIATSYIADSEDVAAAKAAFQAAFDDAAAGGLAAKQEPAPAHVIAAPAPLAAIAAPAVYHAGYPLTALNAVPFGVHGLGYAGLHYPYAGLHLAGYPLVAAAAPEE